MIKTIISVVEQGSKTLASNTALTKASHRKCIKRHTKSNEKQLIQCLNI